jgi:PAS domain S-box-containing protein
MMEVLLVGDPAEDALLQSVLQRRGHTVSSIQNVEQAIERQQRLHFPLVFVSAQSSEGQPRLLRALSSESRDTVVAAVVDRQNSEQVQAAMAAGITDWIERPWQREMLEARIGLLERMVLQVSEQKRLRERLERVENEQIELKKCEETYHSLLEVSPDPIAVHRDGVILYVNPAAVTGFGYPSREAFIGRQVRDVIHPDDLEVVLARIDYVMGTGKPAVLREERFLCWDGGIRVGEVYSFRVQHGGRDAVMSVGHDLTEPRRLESLLMHSERLATIGGMTAGIAHELRNPLMFVVCNLVDLCRRLPGLTDSVPKEVLSGIEKRVETALQGAERLQRLTRELLQFARARDDESMPVDLKAVLDSALSMAGPELHAVNVQIEWGEVPHAWGNELRLSQVFLNLLINAAHAVQQAGGQHPRIVVRGSVDSEGFAIIEVEDTGIGISPQEIDHIFEPFYTTKPAGSGTGLGLAVARTIVHSLGGELSATSTLGQGTTFRVRLRTSPADSATPSGAPA